MIYFGKKKAEYYKNILMMVDLGMHERIFQEIIKRIDVNGRILDLGCGEGALSQRLVDAGYQVTAVDKNPEYFKCQGAHYIKVNFDNEGELNDFIDSYENHFDAVLGIEVIEHVENQWEYVRALKKMCAIDGWMFVSTPNITSWLSRFQFLLTGRFHQFNDIDLNYGHISPLSYWEFNHILSSIGLVKLEYCAVGTLPMIYITSFKTLIASILALPLRLFQSGFLNGWCILAIGNKK